MRAHYRIPAGYGAWVCALLALLILASCATPGARPPAAADPNDEFIGVGRGESLAESFNAAKIDAIRQAVVELAGQNRADAYADVLARDLYATRNPDQYLVDDSIERVRRENLGSTDEMDMVYEMRVRVDLPVLQGALERLGVFGDVPERSPEEEASDAAESRAQDLVTRPGSDSAPEDVQSPEPPPGREITAEDRAFIERYVADLSYMVYFQQEDAQDEFIYRSGVIQANSWLLENGYRAVDADQIERVRQDQREAYEAETGLALSYLQWIAQGLNADVYVELDAQLSSEDRGDSAYGNASVQLSMFETSTGSLLGTVNYQSPQTFSSVGPDDAVLNALQSAVWSAMPRVVAQSRDRMAEQLRRGLRYEIIVQSPPSSRTMARFASQLGSRVVELRRLSQSADEVRYEVRYFGTGQDLELDVYDAADRVSGLETMELVFTRGVNLTFTSGF